MLTNLSITGADSIAEAIKVVGENHPKMSKVLATSETNIRLVMLSRGGNFAMVRRKWSMLEFHSMPRVFVYSSGSGSDCMAWESLRSGGMCSSTFASLEFHFLSGNPPLEKREWSWVCKIKS